MPEHATVEARTRGSWAFLGLAMLSCLLQLVGLYRPSSPPTPDVIPFLDKVGHIVIFILPVLMIMLWRVRVGITRRFRIVLVVIFAGHAVLSELLQAGVLPERSGDPIDVVADLAGIAIGYGTAMLIIAFRKREGR